MEMNNMYIDYLPEGHKPGPAFIGRQQAGAGKQRDKIIVADGLGGHMTLDLSSHELLWLAKACRQLTGEASPPWTTMLKVRCAGVVYLVMRHEAASGDREIEITNMANPAEHVRLSRDLTQLVAALIERSLDTPRPSMAASA